MAYQSPISLPHVANQIKGAKSPVKGATYTGSFGPDDMYASESKAKGYAKGGKVGKVMGEFKRGDLKSGGGHKVTDRKQAIAIGLSEARKRGEKV